MDDRGANIDIVFRNGLKDFEVLPPADVWDNIHPVAVRKQKAFILLRAAAFIGIVLSISFFTYRLTRESQALLDNDYLALDESVFSPEQYTTPENPVAVRLEETVIPGNLKNIPVDNAPVYASGPVSESTSSPLSAPLLETKEMNFNTSVKSDGLSLSSFYTANGRSYSISDPGKQYMPEINYMEGKERWSIAAMASPTYYARFNSGSDEFSKQMMASEQPVISYSGGFALSYRLNKRISVQAGLYYSSLGQDLDGISSFGGFQKYDFTKGDRNFEVLTTSGTIYTNNADVFLLSNGTGDRIITSYTNDVFDPEKSSLQYISSTMRQTFSYLELPIVVRYRVIDKTLALNLIGGMSYNLLVNNSVYTLNDGGKYLIGKTEGLNPVSLSSSIGMGMEYNFSDNLSLNLEPMFRYYINPFSESASSNFHPYSFGIFSGVSYKF